MCFDHLIFYSPALLPKKNYAIVLKMVITFMRCTIMVELLKVHLKTLNSKTPVTFGLISPPLFALILPLQYIDTKPYFKMTII